MIEFDAVTAAWSLIVGRLPTGIVINAIPAALAVLWQKLTLPGAAVGTALGTVIYVGGGDAGWLILCLAFGFAVLSSGIGQARKVAAGIADERDGRRGAGSAIGNCLVGAVGAALIVTRFDDSIGALVLVAGLTAGASDTVASEIGKAFGGTPRAVPSMRPVAAGTPGAVSLIGTISGIAAAAIMAVAAALLQMPGFGMHLIASIVLSATVGSLVESGLASWLEARGVVNNDVLNFINTSVAAMTAVALA